MFKNWIEKKNKRKIISTKKSSSVSIPEVHKTFQKQNNGPQPPATKQRGSPSDRPFEGQTRAAAKGYHEELHQRQARGATKFYDEKLQQRYIRDAAKPSNEVLNQGHTRGAAKPYDEELHQRQIRDAATPYHEVLHQGHTRGAAKPYHEELYQEQVRDAATHYYEELHDRHTMGAAKPYDEELHPEQTRSAAKPCREELRQGQTRVAAKHYYEDLHHASLRSSEGQNGAAIPQVSTSAQSVVLLKNQKPIGKTVSQQTVDKQQKVLKPDVPVLQECPSSNSESGDKRSLQQLTVDLHHRKQLGQKSKTSQGQKLEKNNLQCALAAQQPRATVDQESSQNFQREKLHFTPDNVSAEQIDTGCMMNLKFYQAEIPCQPHGIYIDDIHKWKHNYERLERDHRYIQWLFPIPESHGRNPEAFQLTPHEAEEIKKDKLAFERFLLSYEMMLDFYGMKLDRVTGQLSRSRNYKSRFAHLNRSHHNYMRITRILICLREFDLELYQRQFIRFLLDEAFVEHTLVGTQDSCSKFWIPTLQDDGEREKLEKDIAQLYSRDNVIHSACRILEFTEADPSIGNTHESEGTDRGEESITKELIAKDVNIDERGTDKPKESINKDTTEVTKFLKEENNLETALTNSADAIELHSVTENKRTVTKRPETNVTETQTDCPQTDKTELEVEIISSNTSNSDIKKSGAGEGEIIKCFFQDSTNFICSLDHIPETFVASAEPILADLPSTLETQKTKVETDIQEDDPMDVDLTPNETTLTEDVEKPLETTKHVGFPDIGYNNNNFNQGNLDNLSSCNDAQEPLEITEHNILNYDNEDFDTDSDFEAEVRVSGGESKKLEPEAAEKKPEPEAVEKELELKVEEIQEKTMGCSKSKPNRNKYQYSVSHHNGHLKTAAASVEPTEYECPVCSDYFKHPKLLLCGHVLCRECLVSCLQSNAKATCPLCRCQMVDNENLDSKSAEESADSLIDDVTMARVVESARILSENNVCCVHSSVTASSLCLHCNDMLCKDCCHAHGIISATRHHVVESLTSLTAEKLAASRYVTCSAHNDRIAELFCSTHRVSLCHVCAVSDHSQCPEVANVKKETQAARSQLGQLLVTLGNADLSFKQKSDALSQLELQMKNNTQSVVQTLEEAISYLQRSLEKCHQRLREVRAADVVSLDAVKKSRDKLVKRRGKVVSHMIVVKRVQQTVSGSELLDVAAKLQTYVDRLHLDASVPTDLERVSMAPQDFNPVVLTRLIQDGNWIHLRLVGAQGVMQVK